MQFCETITGVKFISFNNKNIIFSLVDYIDITEIYLINKINKINVKYEQNEKYLLLKNPIDNLDFENSYYLCINGIKAVNTEDFLTNFLNMSIEGNSSAVIFRKFSTLSFPIPSEKILKGYLPIQNIDIDKEKLKLNMSDFKIESNKIDSFYLENEKTKELRKILFDIKKDKVLLDLLEEIPCGEWNLKVLYRLKSFYIMDSIVEGNISRFNESHFVGYTISNNNKYKGVYFENNKLIISSLSLVNFLKVVPMNIEQDIMVEEVLVNNDKLEIKIIDEQINLTQLQKFVLVSRSDDETIQLITQKNQRGNILISLNSLNLDEINNGRWDLVGVFISKENSKCGKLKVNSSNYIQKDTRLNYPINDYSMRLYATKNNYLRILKSDPSIVFKEKNKIKTKVLDIKKIDKSSFKFKIKVKKNEKVIIKKIFLKLRNQELIKTIELKKIHIKDIDESISIVQGTFQMDWDNKYYELYWDLFLICADEQAEEEIRVTTTTKKLEKKINKDYFTNTIYTKDKILYPYVTLKKDIAFMMRERESYETIKNKIREKLAFVVYLFLKPFCFRNKDIWVGFEKFSSTAQDNGYAFFQYVDKNKLHDDFYFILDKNSSDYDKIKQESNNVVSFMSFRYLLLLYASNLLISSENQRHVYNLRIRTGLVPRKVLNKKSVFLQHGVTALKQSNVFKKSKKRGHFDLVIATSNFEKEIIHQNWKYENYEIAVTGFARWDKLFDKSISREKKKIFVMPTWRSWIEGMPKNNFKETDYYKNYIGFLTSPKLDLLLKKYDLELVFFLHPKFKQYITEFQLKNTRIILKNFQDITVNEEIMEASLMISDYSSVTWDMFYMKKPVIFYQFDFEKYVEYGGSYIDMENELFGDRALNINDLVVLIEQYANNGFKLKKQHENLYEKYFKYVDHNNSQRIFDVITDLK